MPRFVFVFIYCWAWALLTVLFVGFPEIDIWFSGLFWTPQEDFFWHRSFLPLLLDEGVLLLSPLLIAAIIAALIWLVIVRKPLWRFEGRAIAYLFLALAIGPGLLVNGVLKENWGRARPNDTVIFGGDVPFTPALAIAGPCDHNCSFVSGQAAMGFFTIAFALLARRPKRRTAYIAAGIATGLVITIGRVAQGAHYLSDGLFAGLIVGGVSWGLYILIVEDRKLDPLGNRIMAKLPRINIGA